MRLRGRFLRHSAPVRRMAPYLPLSVVFTLGYAFVSWLVVMFALYTTRSIRFGQALLPVLAFGRLTSVFCLLYLACDKQFMHPSKRLSRPTLVAYLLAFLLALGCVVLWDNCGWMMELYVAGELW